LVLDGAIDPSLSFSDLVVQQSEGFERNLQHFFDHCAAEGTCAFAQGRDPGHAYDDLRARIEQQPLAVADRTLTDSLFDTGVFTLLYGGQTAWPPLADALAAAQAGDGQPLLASADTYNDRGPDGTYSSLIDAYYAIQCLDGPAIASKSQRAAALWKVQARAAMVAPRLGANNAGSYVPCATTLAPVRHPRLPVAEDAPPILVVNTTEDPATPLAWAEALADELRTAVLVTQPGEGHGLIESLSPCVLDIAQRYLIELEIPQDDTACP
jgi:hypothetical protein